MRLGECVRRSWRTITIGFNIIDQNALEEEVLEILRTPHLRTINLCNMNFYTYDRKNGKLRLISSNWNDNWLNCKMRWEERFSSDF